MDARDGGRGGDARLSGGLARGLGASDTGGDVDISGGAAVDAVGGSIGILGGTSNGKAAGDVVLKTANGGTDTLTPQSTGLLARLLQGGSRPPTR